MPFPSFEGFDEDDIPSASDVVFMLSQYLRSMERFRYDNTTYCPSAREYRWNLSQGEPDRATKRSRFLER